jgi:NAD dependent epimerase/dehydratase family enzyme
MSAFRRFYGDKLGDSDQLFKWIMIDQVDTEKEILHLLLVCLGSFCLTSGFEYT